ncbi:MAG: 30S ribosomal protein S9 [Candidatus Gracilibacteria bacterium]|nr:30S ribosomal protein S9 [Candidatus Gracilibacteria bacterium]
MAESKYYYGTGKRKTAIAKVRLYEKGKGEITVNDKTVKEYFDTQSEFTAIAAPLKLTGNEKTFDISIKVRGSGKEAQADAICHGISRALLEFDIELRPTLKKAGLLTRDPRAKERKKPGLKRARRAPQWSKR